MIPGRLAMLMDVVVPLRCPSNDISHFHSLSEIHRRLIQTYMPIDVMRTIEIDTPPFLGLLIGITEVPLGVRRNELDWNEELDRPDGLSVWPVRRDIEGAMPVPGSVQVCQLEYSPALMAPWTATSEPLVFADAGQLCDVAAQMVAYYGFEFYP